MDVLSWVKWGLLAMAVMALGLVANGMLELTGGISEGVAGFHANNTPSLVAAAFRITGEGDNNALDILKSFSGVIFGTVAALAFWRAADWFTR